MANRSQSHYPDIGVLGEDIVTQWLQSTGWIILHRRWHCPWGELDLVARLDSRYETAGEAGEAGEAGGEKNYQLPITHYQLPGSSPLIAFVEVKTRSKGNWDAGGLLAITPQKQAKLWQAAQCFLTSLPRFCRLFLPLRCRAGKLPEISQPPTKPITQNCINESRGDRLIIFVYSIRTSDKICRLSASAATIPSFSF